jgi:serine-type D-Ala-D-Ala carboxypeptidase/endopeptidase (penicillin-binding protein 4)
VAVSWAVTVSMALLVAWQWTLSRVNLPAAPDAVVAAGAFDGLHLATPMLSTRRAPGVLAHQLNFTSLQHALQPMLDELNDQSCASFSIDGQLVATKNPSTPVIPASDLKLFVAAVALDRLGPNAIFTTRVRGELTPDGVVHGDLYLIGGGDPLLSTADWPTSGAQQYPPINTTRFEDLVDALVARGVKKINGDVVGDGSRYDDEWFAPSWPASDHGTQAGPYDALMVDDGHVHPNQLTIVPAQGAAQVLVDQLRARGIEVDGQPKSGPAFTTAELATVNSAPMTKIVQEMLMTSDNNTAELLLKEIGLQVSGLGTRQAGIKAVMATLQSWNLPTAGLTMVDGSGLSPDDRVTCAALTALLARSQPDDQLGASLPLAGKTGTLASAFVGTAMAGRLLGKTGTLSDATPVAPASAASASAGTTAPPSSVAPPATAPTAVRSLAGYVLPGQDGASPIVFSLVLNGPGVSDPAVWGRVWYQELAPALTGYPATVPVAQLEPLPAG